MKWFVALLPLVVFWALGFGGDLLIGGPGGMAVGVLVPFVGGCWSGMLLFWPTSSAPRVRAERRGERL